MGFFTIFLIVFGGATVLVGADYYIELRAPGNTGASSWGQSEMVTYLYYCKGDAANGHAYTAAASLCVPVTLQERKFSIYANCNFVSVYRPNSRNHVIHLLDRGITSHQTWYLGVLNHAIDHPNFAAPSQDDTVHFIDEINGIPSVTPVAQSFSVSNLAFYFAQNNLIAYFRNPTATNAIFRAYVGFLKRLQERYFDMNQEDATVQGQFHKAMTMALQKMIDPCGILINERLLPFASNYCTTYCRFFNVAALHFDAASSLGSGLSGGRCVGTVCQCIRDVSPLAGCQTIPMQQCNNGMRLRLNL